MGSSARGSLLTVAGSGFSLGVQLVSVLTLSRLLLPEDFGLVAMVQVFVAFGNLLRDFGLPTAALRAPRLSEQQGSNLFWLNLGLSIAVACVLVGATPLVVALYSEPRLGAIMPIMAIVVVLNGAASQVRVRLARGLRFRSLVVCDVGSQMGALAIAIALASSGVGYWALVVQALANAALLLVGAWAFSGWIPRAFRRGVGTAPLLRDGVEYGISQVLWFVQNSAPTVIIGRLLGPIPLGLYNRANQIASMPVGKVTEPLTRVVIPILNNAAKDTAGRLAILLRVQFSLTLLLTYGLGVVAVSAPQLVPLVLGDGWSAVAPILRILAIGGCFHTLTQVTSWGFIMADNSRMLLYYNLASKPLAILCIFLGSLSGLLGAVWGYVIAVGVSWLLGLAWLRIQTGWKMGIFALTGALLLFSGAVSGACILWILHAASVANALAVISWTVGGVALFMLAILSCVSTTRQQLQFALLSLSRILRRQ